VRWPCMWTSILRHIIQKRIPGVMWVLQFFNIFCLYWEMHMTWHKKK
jgi:hypothetical protein